MRKRLSGAGVTAALAVAIGCLAAVGAAAAGAVTAASRSDAPRGLASARGLDVLPFPGTPDAAPGTNIYFPTVSPSQLRGVAVIGSRSGLHRGSMRAQPAGHGTAFSPARPFAPGERVSVSATFRSPGAGTASGTPGQRRISFLFSVARPRSCLTAKNRSSRADRRRRAGPDAMSTSQPLTHTFVTEPGFTPPIVTMKGKDTDPAAGDIFLGALNTGQGAPYILDPRGNLLWYQPTPTSHKHGLSARDVRVQSFQGKPVLTFWQGSNVKPPGGGRGVDMILNEHYQAIRKLTAGNGYQSQGIDLHEFFLGHDGSEPVAFVPIWSPAQANLMSVGGPPIGSAYDWIIQEIDIATGRVIWEWHALGHVPVSDSYLPYVFGQTYDFFHLNSIQQLPGGNILISARNTWTVYLINKATGNIVWRLGGKRSSFKMGAGTNFEWQHDAILQNHGLLTLFDDGAAPKVESQSRSLELHLGKTKHRGTLIQAFEHSPPALATSQGSAQLLSNGHVFVGWGSKPYFSEYTAGGKQLFSGSFRSPVASYRAYRFSWVGKPLQRPAVAVKLSSTTGKDIVYASWNGATKIAKWQVLTSSSLGGPFAKTGSPAPWSGFETKMQRAKAGYFKVEALDSRGRVLRTSAAVAGP